MNPLFVVVIERVMKDGSIRTDFEYVEARFGNEAVPAALHRLITNDTDHIKSIKWDYLQDGMSRTTDELREMYAPRRASERKPHTNEY